MALHCTTAPVLSPAAEAIRQEELARHAAAYKPSKPTWMRDLALCEACGTLVYPREHKEDGKSCRMRAANRYGAKP